VVRAAFPRAVSACHAAPPSPTSSTAASTAQGPTASIASPTPSSTASSGARPTSSPATSSSATFNVFPVPQAPGFVSTIACSGTTGASDPVLVVPQQASAE